MTTHVDPTYTISRTSHFESWLRKLRDGNARARIAEHIDRLSRGNPGHAKPLGGGLSELRLHFGPGYRLYYAVRGDRVIILLAGGDKSSQPADIRLARSLLAAL